MTFEVPRRVLRLVFPDRLGGLTVRAYSLSIGEMMDMSHYTNIKIHAFMSDDERADVEKLFSRFADCLIEWNLTNDGYPVPPDINGVMSIDPMFVQDLITSWLITMSSVPEADPLPQPSIVGARSVEASIPMEPLSESQSN